MTTLTVVSLDEPVRRVPLTGTAPEFLLTEMLRSSLFEEDEKLAIIEGISRLSENRDLSLAYVILYAVRPAMARWGEEIQDQLFEWEERFISLLPEGGLEQIEALDLKRRALIAKIEGVREGYLEGRHILTQEARKLNQQRVEMQTKTVHEIDAITERVRVLHQQEQGAASALQGLKEKSQTAGVRLDSIEKELQPVLDYAEKLIKQEIPS